MDKISNKQLEEYTKDLTEFVNHTDTVFARSTDELYVVYSYGEHFPMYIYDHQSEMWFGNSDRYSPTTTRHQTLAQPQDEMINRVTTQDLLDIIHCGGYRNYCSDRCGVLVYGRSTQGTLLNQRRA